MSAADSPNRAFIKKNPKVVIWLAFLATLNGVTIYLVGRDIRSVAETTLAEKHATYMPTEWDCGEHEKADGAIVDVWKRQALLQGPATSQLPVENRSATEATGYVVYAEVGRGLRMQVQCKKDDWVRAQVVQRDAYFPIVGWLPRTALSPQDQRKSK